MVYSRGTLCCGNGTVDGWEEGGVFAWVSNTLGPDGDLQRSHLAICKSPLVLFHALFRVRGTLLHPEMASAE